jgi:hypothetical protein
MTSNYNEDDINRRKKPNLTNDEREGILQFLLAHLKHPEKLDLEKGV